MLCQSNNATGPSPAIAPGIDPDARRAAEFAATRFAGSAVDPRVSALVPAFDAPFFQAGLAGYSEAAMRLIARRHGCPLCVTEALLDRTLLAGGRGFAKADLGEIDDNVPGGADDHPLAGQLMGSDPREMAAAALKMVEQGRARSDRAYRELAYDTPGVFPGPPQHLRLPGGVQVGRVGGTEHPGRTTPSLPSPPLVSSGTGVPPVRAAIATASFEVIDVNLACPVKKIDRKARGGHWLAQPDGAIAILEAVRQALPPDVPCTVKLRRAYDDTPEMAAAFDRILAAAFDMGYAWATVHARTVEQKYVGPSRWDLLRDIVRRHPSRPIFGSGDVWQAEDIPRMIAYTGVSAVSVARGCIGNPWIFRQARDLLAGRPPRPPTIPEQRAVLLDHFDLALRVNRTLGIRRHETYTSRAMRKFGIRFAAHHPRAEEVRLRMIAVDSLDSWRAAIDEFYAT
ncbi:MAG: tRNA-dihydrouridine synthase family protein [Phycisphaerae bacterium]|nr:tRNA-dihydrouridine synthase family protein [Phycisphaerae bacterium]